MENMVDQQIKLVSHAIQIVKLVLHLMGSQYAQAVQLINLKMKIFVRMYALKENMEDSLIKLVSLVIQIVNRVQHPMVQIYASHAI